MTSEGRSLSPWDALDAWLPGWFEENLTGEAIEGRTDDEWSALLVSDLAAAGFVVTAPARTPSSTTIGRSE